MERDLRIHSIRCTRTCQENYRHLGNRKFKNSNKPGKRVIKLILVNPNLTNYISTENLSNHNFIFGSSFKNNLKYVNLFQFAS